MGGVGEGGMNNRAVKRRKTGRKFHTLASQMILSKRRIESLLTTISHAIRVQGGSPRGTSRKTSRKQGDTNEEGVKGKVVLEEATH